jgi:molybdopterin synthase sulfur carrier subunit
VPKVFIPTLLRHLTDGRAELDIEGATVRQLIDNLEAQYPGFAERLLDNGRIRTNIAIAIDDDIAPLNLSDPLKPQSEVHFLTAIRGG